MIMMMNKKFPAYVGNFLRDQGFNETFLWNMFKATCCQTKLAECESCTWDAEMRMLTTQKEKEQNKTDLDLENALWFKNSFEGLDLESGLAGNKQQAPPPEALFDLDGKRSVKTIHECHIAKAMMGSSPPQQKGKKNEAAIEVNSSDDKDSKPRLATQGRAIKLPKGLMKHPPPLVLRTARMRAQPMADSCRQLPSLVHGEGIANGVKWFVQVQAWDQH
jgi:hypothetical protein